MDEYTRTTPLSAFCCFSFSSKFCLVRFVHTPVPLVTEHFHHMFWWAFFVSMRSWTWVFTMAGARPRPRWYTTEQCHVVCYELWNEDNVASFLLCSMFCCLCVVDWHCVLTLCLCCILSQFVHVYNQSSCGKYIFRQLHNHNVSVLLTKRKPTLQLHYLCKFQAIALSRNRSMRYLLPWVYCSHTLFSTAGLPGESSHEQ